MSITGIITGHRNNILRDKEDIETLSAERLAICGKCTAMRERKATGLVCSRRATVQHVDGHTVKGCGCPLNAKTRSKEQECPAGKWGPVFDE